MRELLSKQDQCRQSITWEPCSILSSPKTTVLRKISIMFIPHQRRTHTHIHTFLFMPFPVRTESMIKCSVMLLFKKTKKPKTFTFDLTIYGYLILILQYFVL